MQNGHWLLEHSDNREHQNIIKAKQLYLQNVNIFGKYFSIFSKEIFVRRPIKTGFLVQQCSLSLN
jgi:hypothetical protein